MYPELWLHDLARERRRDMLEIAARSAPRGIGEEYLASDAGSRQRRNDDRYVGHLVQLLCNWARRHMVPETRVRD